MTAVEAGGVRAALVHDDLDAVTLVGLLQSRGLRVPEDLAIVTCDDEVAELSDVPLTAVAPPRSTTSIARKGRFTPGGTPSPSLAFASLPMNPQAPRRREPTSGGGSHVVVTRSAGRVPR